MLRLKAIVALLLFAAAAPALAQRPVHYRYEAMWPPGSIGQQQLRRGGPLRGYFQPVAIEATGGMQLSLAVDGAFQPLSDDPLHAGMLIGQVYRLKVTKIPLRHGLEVFPTIEVIDRLYPPQGQKTRFPIRIQITNEDVQLALRGRYVTRVIYLENPTAAMPLREDPKLQRWFEVRPQADPLKVADELGRPVAILRLGSRLPPEHGADNAFLFGSPPLQLYDPPAGPAAAGEVIDDRPALPGHEARLPNYQRIQTR